MQVFDAQYGVAGALTSATLLVKHASCKGGGGVEVNLNKQFCRDVRSGMLRVGVAIIPSKAKFQEAATRRGRSEDEEQLLWYAWKQVLRAAGEDTALAHRITSLANQNLGALTYADVS